MTRYAVVALVRDPESVKHYLPGNYRVLSQHLAEPEDPWRVNVVIAGEDNAGWTLDDYVIPRLASGNYACKEYKSHTEAVEFAAGAMN